MLIDTQREMDSIKRDTKLKIEELEQQNQALRNELMRMKNVLLNPALQQKKENLKASSNSDNDTDMEAEVTTEDDSEFTCMECSYQTNSDDNLKIHMKETHEVIDKIKCDQCNKDFGEKNEL